MKILNLIPAVIITSILFSCGGAETKADPAVRDAYNKEGKVEDKIQEAASELSSKTDSTSIIPDNNEILSKIDKYLVTTPVYIIPATGNSISNATVTVKNTLSNITFQKAIIEVNVLDNEGKLLRNDYYTIQNIEPGDVETIKLPDTPKATSINSHIVKIKSNILTNGEMIIVGSHHRTVN